MSPLKSPAKMSICSCGGCTHLVDYWLPMASYRQFAVIFPIPMRHGLQSHRDLSAKVYCFIIKGIRSYYKKKALAS